MVTLSAEELGTMSKNILREIGLIIRAVKRDQLFLFFIISSDLFAKRISYVNDRSIELSID